MHRNAPLTPEGRLRLCLRIEVGWAVATAAESMNISRQCADKWWRRYRSEGLAGLVDRSSRSTSGNTVRMESAPRRSAAISEGHRSRDSEHVA